MNDAQETANCSFPGIIHISVEIPRCCKQHHMANYSLHLSCTSSYMPTSLHTNFFGKKTTTKTLNYKALHPVQTQYRSDA